MSTELFKNGHALAYLPEFERLTPEEIETIITSLNDPPRVTFDWYYTGGVVTVVYAGTLEHARNAFERAIPRMNYAIAARCYQEADRDSYARARLMLYGPPMVSMERVTTSPNALSIGQVYQQALKRDT